MPTSALCEEAMGEQHESSYEAMLNANRLRLKSYRDLIAERHAELRKASLDLRKDSELLKQDSRFLRRKDAFVINRPPPLPSNLSR